MHLLYSLAYGSQWICRFFWEDIIIKLNKKHREKVVPYTRFLSLLMMNKMKEGYGDGEVTSYPTQVFSVGLVDTVKETLEFGDLGSGVGAKEVLVTEYYKYCGERGKREQNRSLALKAKKNQVMKIVRLLDSEDEEYAMACAEISRNFSTNEKIRYSPHMMKESYLKEIKTTKMAKAKENVLNVEIQTISSGSVQNYQETTIKEPSSEDHGVIGMKDK
ncbi:hypothetical protein Tco_1541713 [Tanacetum coccineum]